MTERPEFRIAPDEHKNSRQKKTSRPYKLCRRPTSRQITLKQHEETGNRYEQSRQVVVKFAFSLVSEDLGLQLGGGGRIVHGHGHVFVVHAVVVHAFMARLVLLAWSLLRAYRI